MPIPKNFAKPAKISAKERALGQIQRWIIDGTLVPGEKLMDMELSEALGISRTPIREALQILEIQGFVEIRQGKETRVTGIRKNDILKIYPPLAAMQSLAAELAAPEFPAGQIERLKDLNAEFAALMERGRPYKAMEKDEEIHDIIVEAADNPYIASFSATMLMHIRRFKFIFLRRITDADRASVQEHDLLIEALERRDAVEAGRLMRLNFMRPMNELYKALEDEETPAAK